MKLFLVLALWTLGLSAPVRAEDASPPNQPVGQILDRAAWLGLDRAQSLETRLRRYRAELGIDIMVVVWDRAIPEEKTLDQLARELGGEWAREGLWAVVLAAPSSMQRPAIQYGGIVADQIDSESLDRAVQEAVDRGLKDWTEEARVESVAIEVGEEFAYLIQRRAQEMALIRERVAQVTEIHHQKKKRTAATLIVVCAALAVTLCVMVHFWLKRRRSGPYEFPETRWRKRLGGTWSGGSTVAASLPSSHSS